MIYFLLTYAALDQKHHQILTYKVGKQNLLSCYQFLPTFLLLHQSLQQHYTRDQCLLKVFKANFKVWEDTKKIYRAIPKIVAELSYLFGTLVFLHHPLIHVSKSQTQESFCPRQMWAAVRHVFSPMLPYIWKRIWNLFKDDELYFV